MLNFLKGIVIGLGGIAPGLSGSVLLVIFGLYQKTISCISEVFKDALAIIGFYNKEKLTRKEAWKDFLERLKFLVPLALGMGIGIVMFSKLIKFLLENYEMYTRYTFLGLILGTIPLLYREVKKKGFHGKYYIVMGVSATVGIALFYFSGNMFAPVFSPNVLQSVVLGIAVAASYIVPGVDSATILNALGLYHIWVSITSFEVWDFATLIPVVLGLGIGVMGVSTTINKLIEKCYTLTFSVIFGLFLSIIPTILEMENQVTFEFGQNTETVICLILLVLGFVASLLFSNLEQLKEKLK